MTPIKNQREIKKITRMVERYLEPHQPKDQSYRLKVFHEGLKREDDWTYVLVLPEPEEGVRSYDYVARLVEAEGDIEENEHQKVMLVPAFPD